LKPWPELAFAKTSSRLEPVRPKSAFGPGTGVAEDEGVALRLGVVVGEPESDGVVEGVAEAEGVGVFEGVTPCGSEAVGVRLTDAVTLGDAVIEGEVEGVALGDGVGLADCVGGCDGERLGVPEAGAASWPMARSAPQESGDVMTTDSEQGTRSTKAESTAPCTGPHCSSASAAIALPPCAHESASDPAPPKFCPTYCPPNTIQLENEPRKAGGTTEAGWPAGADTKLALPKSVSVK
jgi:hypothetical protein